MAKKPNLKSISEQQLLHWIWTGLRVPGRCPRSFEEMLRESACDTLDELRPLPIAWRSVTIVGAAFPVCQDIWLSNEKSPLHDLLETTKCGVLVVSDSTTVASAESLHVVFQSTDELDALAQDPDDNPCLVHPGWGVSCEKLMQKRKNDE